MESRIGVVLGVLAVVLVIVAMIGPWWVVDTSGRLGAFTVTSHDEFNFFGRTTASQSNLSSSTNTTGYGDLPQTGSLFSIALILFVLGLVSGIGMIVIGVLSGRSPAFRRFTAIAGLFAFLFLFVAALYVMVSLPGAVSQDSGLSSSNAFSGFWGTRSATAFGGFVSGTTTWAAGWAWYVAVVAAILFLVGAVATVSSRRPKGVPPPASP